MAAVEFAILAPVLASTYMIGVDVVLLIRNRFRVDQSAAQLMQIASQYSDLYVSDFTGTFFPIAETIAGNNQVLAQQPACAIIVSGLDTKNHLLPAGAGNALTVMWQQKSGTCVVSKVGLPNASATLPGSYIPPIGLPLIVVEVAAQRTLHGPSAVLLGVTQNQYSVAMAIPRTRVLAAVTAGNRP